MQTPCCRAGGEHFGPVLCDSVDARRVRKGMSVLAGCLEPLESFRRARRGHPKVVEIKGAAKEKELLKRAVIDLRQEQHSVRYVPEGVHVPDAVVGVFGQGISIWRPRASALSRSPSMMCRNRLPARR